MRNMFTFNAGSNLFTLSVVLTFSGATEARPEQRLSALKRYKLKLLTNVHLGLFGTFVMLLHVILSNFSEIVILTIIAITLFID